MMAFYLYIQNVLHYCVECCWSLLVLVPPTKRLSPINFLEIETEMLAIDDLWKNIDARYFCLQKVVAQYFLHPSIAALLNPFQNTVSPTALLCSVSRALCVCVTAWLFIFKPIMNWYDNYQQMIGNARKLIKHRRRKENDDLWQFDFFLFQEEDNKK